MKIETIKSKGFAVSVMLFPIMLLAGFLMHPDLLEMKMLHTAQDLVDRFHNNQLYHMAFYRYDGCPANNCSNGWHYEQGSGKRQEICFLGWNYRHIRSIHFSG